MAVNDGSNQETLDWKRKEERDGVTGLPEAACVERNLEGWKEKEESNSERGT